jgi:hypothetical protein
MKTMKGVIWLQIFCGVMMVFLPKRMEVPPFVKDPAVAAWMLVLFGTATLGALHGTLSKKKGE